MLHISRVEINPKPKSIIDDQKSRTQIEQAPINMVYSSDRKVNGTRIKYNRTAVYSGSQFVLILHSPSGSTSDFDRLLSEWNDDGLTLVTCELDWNVPEGRTWQQNWQVLAEQAITLMQELFYTPLHVCGQGDAGLMALHLAACYPSHVRSLIIWDTILTVQRQHLSCEQKAVQHQTNKMSLLAAQQTDLKFHFDQKSARISTGRLQSIEQPVLMLINKGQLEQAIFLNKNTPSASKATHTATSDVHTTEHDWFRKTMQQFIYSHS